MTPTDALRGQLGAPSTSVKRTLTRTAAEPLGPPIHSGEDCLDPRDECVGGHHRARPPRRYRRGPSGAR